MSYLGYLSSPSHSKVRNPHQHVALLADVSQPPPIAAGLLLRHQPDVAGQLLAAVKALRKPYGCDTLDE